jgi:hypothetical protein
MSAKFFCALFVVIVCAGVRGRSVAPLVPGFFRSERMLICDRAFVRP